MKVPHVHWWRYNGWDSFRGEIYFCRCRQVQYRWHR